MNLAKIIAEGERLHANRGVATELIEQMGADAWLSRFYVRHGHALLAVAKAAAEKFDADDALRLERQKATVDQVALEKAYARHYAGNAALRLAVRGDAKGGERG